MANKRDTKTELIRAGMELIGTQGYNATGIGAILKQAGVPKGSFYHYFESKEEFGLTIIETFTEKFLKRVDAYLLDDSLTPLNRLRTFLEKGLEQAESHQFTTGCLIGDLAQELAAKNERLRVRLDAVMLSWSERFAACLREAQEAGELLSSTNPRQDRWAHSHRMGRGATPLQGDEISPACTRFHRYPFRYRSEEALRF